ncbi:MAG: hypothetical protein IJM45_10910 [Clostridia bacterium]|nr:hypothetical protein [Clostridia bacterium]
MRKSAKTALGGIISALSLIVMLLSALIPNLTYVLPMIAGAVIMIMVEEIGKGWSFLAYITVSILSFLIIPDKEVAMMYAAFFGYYPIVKRIFELKLKKAPAYICKFLVFNISIAAAYLLIIKVFLIPVEGLGDFGVWTVPVLAVLGNLTFFIYDRLLSKMMAIYNGKVRKRFKGMFK